MIQALTKPFEVLRAAVVERRLELKRHIVDYIAQVGRSDFCVLCGSATRGVFYRRNGTVYVRKAEAHGCFVCLNRSGMLEFLHTKMFGSARHPDRDTIDAADTPDPHQAADGLPLCTACLHKLHQHPAPSMSDGADCTREILPLEIAMRIRSSHRDIRAFAEGFSRRAREELVRAFAAKRLNYKLDVLDEQIAVSYGHYHTALALGETSDAESLRTVHNDLCIMRQQLLKRLEELSAGPPS